MGYISEGFITDEMKLIIWDLCKAFTITLQYPTDDNGKTKYIELTKPIDLEKEHLIYLSGQIYNKLGSIVIEELGGFKNEKETAIKGILNRLREEKAKEIKTNGTGKKGN